MPNTKFKIGVIRPVECFKEGWELIKDQYWLLFGITLVGAMIGGASLYIAFGAMICGIFYCYFQKIDGRAVKFEDLFKGFDYFLAGLIVVIFIVVPLIIVYAFIYLPFIIAIIMGSKLSQSEFITLLTSSLLIDLIFVVLMVCLHTLLIFSFPLIVDRNLSGWQAMRLSARAVWGNLSGVAGLFVVGFGINLVGMLLFCVGIYFTVPIIIAGNIVAYRKVFPRLEEPSFIPPPPDAYRGAGGYN